MKAKLIKNPEGYDTPYILTDMEDNLIASTEGKLSLKNCEAIANGYDLDELAISTYPFDNKADVINAISQQAFIKGFQKALEVNADKRFTLEDMMNCWNKALTFQDHKELFGYHIQSLQQNEWDVEIEMESVLIGQCDCPCHSEGATIMHYMACCHPKMVESLKLDADGCLILKRK